jgi:hypothetical protein
MLWKWPSKRKFRPEGRGGLAYRSVPPPFAAIGQVVLRIVRRLPVCAQLSDPAGPYGQVVTILNTFAHSRPRPAGSGNQFGTTARLLVSRQWCWPADCLETHIENPATCDRKIGTTGGTPAPLVVLVSHWSERRDSNSGPLAPHARVVFPCVPVYSYLMCHQKSHFYSNIRHSSPERTGTARNRQERPLWPPGWPPVGGTQ